MADLYKIPALLFLCLVFNVSCLTEKVIDEIKENNEKLYEVDCTERLEGGFTENENIILKTSSGDYLIFKKDETYRMYSYSQEKIKDFIHFYGTHEKNITEDEYIRVVFNEVDTMSLEIRKGGVSEYINVSKAYSPDPDGLKRTGLVLLVPAAFTADTAAVIIVNLPEILLSMALNLRF